MDSMINRVRAEEDIRQLAVVNAGMGEGAKDHMISLKTEMGTVVDKEEVFDWSGWKQLKNMAG